MKKIYAVPALLAAAVLAAPASSRAAAAPDFKLAKVLNAPVSKVNGLKDLKGKVIFLEFWATWCGPCVASIPHMNRLHDALKGEPVVFLAVTDEPADRITPFLKTHEMKSWVGIDKEESSFKAYKVVGRPDGYLIGRDGNLLARIFPANLEEKDVRDALAGNFTPRPIEWDDVETQAKRPAASQAIFEINISSASGKRGMTGGWNKLETQSWPFAHSIAHVWQVVDDQVILDTKPVDSFNLTLRTPPGGMEKGREVLKDAIQTAFNIQVVQEQRETDVYALKLSPAAGAPRPKPGAPDVELGLISYGGGKLVGTAEMRHIALAIWASMDRPVVDETNLKGVFEFDLGWEYGNLADAERILAGEGLLLTPARRTIDFIRVTPALQKGP